MGNFGATTAIVTGVYGWNKKLDNFLVVPLLQLPLMMMTMIIMRWVNESNVC